MDLIVRIDDDTARLLGLNDPEAIAGFVLGNLSGALPQMPPGTTITEDDEPRLQVKYDVESPTGIDVLAARRALRWPRVNAVQFGLIVPGTTASQALQVVARLDDSIAELVGTASGLGDLTREHPDALEVLDAHLRPLDIGQTVLQAGVTQGDQLTVRVEQVEENPEAARQAAVAELQEAQAALGPDDEVPPTPEGMR